MRAWEKIAALVIASMALSACDYDTDLNVLQTVMTWNQVGYSPDQWLEQYSHDRREWDKLALIVGFGDDHEGCTDLANGLAQKFPRALLRCVAAN